MDGQGVGEIAPSFIMDGSKLCTVIGRVVKAAARCINCIAKGIPSRIVVRIFIVNMAA